MRCRSGTRAGGHNVVAQPPAAIGGLVNESSSAALRFDEPQIVEFVAFWLVEFRPESHEIGIWDGTRLAINTRSTDRSVTVRSAGEIVTSANLSTSRMTGRPTLGFGAGRRGGRSAKRTGMWGVIVVAATTRRVDGDSFSGDRLGSRRHDAWSWRQVHTAGNVITAPLLGPYRYEQ